MITASLNHGGRRIDVVVARGEEALAYVGLVLTLWKAALKCSIVQPAMWHSRLQHPQPSRLAICLLGCADYRHAVEKDMMCMM
mmetsp:Transcript_52607/g.104544  ORF Transcript_52607/g.104544 Transcript_52607/m.104544 type:complete len:83 (+) Transcript_52607:681-929(+)